LPVDVARIVPRRVGAVILEVHGSPGAGAGEFTGGTAPDAGTEGEPKHLKFKFQNSKLKEEKGKMLLRLRKDVDHAAIGQKETHEPYGNSRLAAFTP
jgi:hypothetical protein